jgi:hypothetical protein
MRKELKFHKEYNPSQWYVDLPEYPGSKSDLEMVLGGDLLCEILAQGEDTVTVTIDTKHKLSATLTFNRLENEGAWYFYESEFNEFPLWLCKVTEYVFGEFPEKIHISKSHGI